METLAVFHILKNAGTTLIDRYKHNEGFVYQRVANEVIYRYQSETQQSYYIDECNEPQPQVVFGHGVTFDWDNRLQNCVKYATILRDPIDRIMSAFNYFRTEMASVHDKHTDIDFLTWIINCSRMLPTPVYNQYQQFSKQTCLRIDYGRKIDTVREKQLFDEAVKNITRLSSVFFVEDNYIKKFDKLVKQYGLTPEPAVNYQHSTKFKLSQLGLDYLHYDDLDDTDKRFVEQTTARDVEFYNYCKEKFA